MEFLRRLKESSMLEEKPRGGSSRSSGVGAPVIKYAERMGNLSIDEDYGVAKVTKERIYSCALCPSSSSIAVAAGDKIGNLGLWMPGGDGRGDGVRDMQRISSSVVAHILWDRNDSNKLLASCYDGRIVRLDAAKAAFTEVARSEGTAFFELDSPADMSVLYASDEDGYVWSFDPRAGMSCVTKFEAHDKKVNTIHLNPVNPYYAATASLDRSVAFWDLRMVSDKKAKPTHYMPQGLSVNCAYFSPDGTQVCVLEMSNRLKVYDFTSINQGGPSKSPPQPLHNVYHNNRTGRWLTKFKPQWDTKQPDCFLTGSMEQPRCIETWASRKESGLKLVMRTRDDMVGSVQSIVSHHISKDVVATANASGKVYIWG